MDNSHMYDHGIASNHDIAAETIFQPAKPSASASGDEKHASGGSSKKKSKAWWIHIPDPFEKRRRQFILAQRARAMAAAAASTSSESPSGDHAES